MNERPDPDFQPQHLPDEIAYDEDDADRVQRRLSTSTVGSRSRREGYYDSQRISSRRSRPISGESQTSYSYSSKSTKSRGKQRASNQQSADYSFVDVHVDHVPPPVPTPAKADSSHLEDERGPVKSHDPGTGLVPHVRNFSQPYTMRRRGSRANSRDMNLSEVAALPPVPTNHRSSANMGPPPENEKQDTSGDTEPGNKSQSESERPYSRRHPQELEKPQPPVPRWLNELHTVSYLIFFSVLGTLARLGVQWLTFYPGAPVTTPVLWANVGGSYVMGFLSEDQGLFRGRAHEAALAEDQTDETPLDRATITKHNKTIPLYIGLATGFCGSFTSFSSFARDFFLAASNSLPAPIYHTYTSPTGVVAPSQTVSRDGGYSLEAYVAVILATLALCLGALIVGAHTAVMLDHVTPAIPTRLARRIIDPLFVFLGFGCWLGALFLAIFPPSETWRGEVLFALVFAPLGALLRFYASLKLNGLVAAFPLGTFAVNMFGTAVEGMCYDIQHVGVGVMGGAIGGGLVGCQILQGIMDGFCGCLTTVSTWVSEINSLKRKHGYLYALASVGCATCLMAIIMGSVRWSIGFSEPACNTGYPSKVHG
ncbi:Fluoride export protein 1 [Fulvia fulva]|uniref:Fluoride export protein 1 n=1 Tax=Passalora fulva TaxID=5499 RepID=A0A9Q8P5I1_PASFU|nr:Fluoride export protein 1 [Fulvia fulva]KAK4632104.1 Fluoride export protein 1 [Fulvia fulva]KAK4633449.1 Fluoride export protein 1 [Fulvia fulva]UJO13787.1 Fluoride export protein 1 [Fulvia fulva]WPV11207.1 Fluoride export protein 1 [Fulvia fulva]WPV26866.1 Fluoride export protein 1 [Fulvia fulva]